ncbi:MAG: Flp pilus assembly protein CpaB [Bryobacteraceae bacterium]
MKRNLVPLLGIAFVVAVASTGIFYGLFVGKLKSSPPVPVNNLVVAARAIKPGTVLAAADLKTTPWAAERLPYGTFGEPEKLIGSTALGPIAENEPVIEERLSAREGRSGGPTSVPSGLRAVSVHVSDSTGVLALLRPGHKVDVQVVTAKATDPEARTIAQDLTVVSVNLTPEPLAQGFTAPVVTLLANPAEVDVLALADAAARVRLTLRNSLDNEKTRFGQLGLNGLLRGAAPSHSSVGSVSAPAAAKRPVLTGAGLPSPVNDSELTLSVRFAGATSAAFEELGRALVTPGHSGEFQASAFRAGTQPEAVWKKLQDDRQVDLITSSRLLAGFNRSVSVEAGSLSQKTNDVTCGLRVRFAPIRTADGKFKLRVQPEVVSPLGASSGVRRSETEVDVQEGQWFLVSGLTAARESAVLSEKLFPLQPQDAAREFLMMVSARLTRHHGGQN